MTNQENHNDSTAYKALLEAILANKSNPLNKPFDSIMSERTYHSMKQHLQDTGVRDGDHKMAGFSQEFNVTTSPHVPDGVMYTMPKVEHKLEWKREAFTPPPEIPNGFMWHGLQDRIWERIVGTLGLPPKLIRNPNEGRRRWKETLLAWGIRLEELRLMDDMEYREMYQKAVLKTVFTSPARLFKRLLGKES